MSDSIGFLCLAAHAAILLPAAAGIVCDENGCRIVQQTPQQSSGGSCASGSCGFRSPCAFVHQQAIVAQPVVAVKQPDVFVVQNNYPQP